METHKDSMHRILNEKYQEHAKEKENLIELHQNKFNDYETREQTLSKRIKELTKLINSQAKTNKTRDEEEATAKKKEMENMEQMQGKFDEHLRQMKNKYEIDLHRVKLELNDNYKQDLIKSKHEIEQIQAHVIKLKKSNTDSDKVIESSKLEMDKMNKFYLNTLTSSIMNSERDKQRLKDNHDEETKKLNEELVSLKEKVHAVLIPKMIDALREYKVNETIISMKMI